MSHELERKVAGRDVVDRLQETFWVNAENPKPMQKQPKLHYRNFTFQKYLVKLKK
jgi:hypothetical protein